VLCAGSTLLLVQSKALDEAPYKLSGAVVKLASITFLSLAFSYWTIKPWFLTEGKLLLCSSYLPLGVPNWSVVYISTGAIKERRLRKTMRSDISFNKAVFYIFWRQRVSSLHGAMTSFLVVATLSRDK
jgi:hypothetical protein